MSTATKAKTTTSIPTSEWDTNWDGELRGVWDAEREDTFAEPAPLVVGDRGYLIESVDTNRGTTSWTMSTAPGLTNQSHEPRAEGWLGSTNNVSKHGRGYAEVVHIGPRIIRLRQIPLVEQDGQAMSPDEHLAELATTWRESQTSEAAARDALAAAARTAHEGGMSAYRLAQITGAAPDTVRKWLQS